MEISAKELGIEIKWEGKGVDEKGYDSNSGKRIVFIDPRYFRPTEVDTLFGDSSKAREKLGWKPRISFEDMIIEMTRSDLGHAQKDLQMQNTGFKTFNYHE